MVTQVGATMNIMGVGLQVAHSQVVFPVTRQIVALGGSKCPNFKIP